MQVQIKYSTGRRHSTKKSTIMDVCGYSLDDTCSTYENYNNFYKPASYAPQPQLGGPLSSSTHNGSSKNSPTTAANTFSFATAKLGSKPLNLKTSSNGAPAKAFEHLKNGNYKLAVSNYKSLVISKFNGYVYIHFWGPKGKHISFNTEELSTLFACRDTIERQIKTVHDVEN